MNLEGFAMNNNNNRARYPPGISTGRGGGGAAVNANPAIHSGNPQQQQYVQRNQLGQQQFQQNYPLQSPSHPQQQQHWSRRHQIAGTDPSVVEVQKTVQSEAVDSGYGLLLCLSLGVEKCLNLSS